MCLFLGNCYGVDRVGDYLCAAGVRGAVYGCCDRFPVGHVSAHVHVARFVSIVRANNLEESVEVTAYSRHLRLRVQTVNIGHLLVSRDGFEGSVLGSLNPFYGESV